MSMIDDPTVADVLRDLQITHGNPTAEELAIVAALVSASGQAGQVLGRDPVPASVWAAPARRLRGPLPTGGWRRSALR